MFPISVVKLLLVLFVSERSLAGKGSELCERRGSPVHGVTHVKLKRPSGVAVVYTCEPGYVLQGAALAVCVHGAWTHPLPLCNRDIALASDTVNDGIAGDSGVIVSMSELDTIPPRINEVEEKKRKVESKEKQNKEKRKKRKRKGKRRTQKRRDKKKIPGNTARGNAAKRKPPLDMSCVLGTVKTPGFVRAPTILNAFSPRYSRRKNPRGRYLAATYTCIPGYTFRNPRERTLACSGGRWVGKRPVCGQADGALQSSRSCMAAGCEHDCKVVDGNPECFCFRGFKQDGKLCHDINECAEDKGGCDVTCVNTAGSYFCQCEQGFRLSYDQTSCEDINECILRNGHGPCQGQCLNTLGSYQCNCKDIPGTRLEHDRHSCEDIDECNDTEHSMGCSHSCINTIGTAFCHCPDGYKLGPDWKTCEDINECEQEEVLQKCDFRCVNSQGSYRCALAEGDSDEHDDYDEEDKAISTMCTQGYNKINGECVDVDECEDSPCSQDCINTPGSFTCFCGNGYNVGDDQKTCYDIDECSEFSGGTLCSHECINTIGSYSCKCPDNHDLASDHRTCHPTEDECQKMNCSHDCIIENETALCVCDSGFYLEDQNSCADINECLGEPGCSHKCMNEEGTFRCLCPEGFHLLPDNRNCKTDNQCPLKCTHNCVQENGKFKCSCPVGYCLNDDQVSCDDVNECLNKHLCSHDCTNTKGSYVCECPEGFRLGHDMKTCEDINECLLVVDEDASICSHNCTNTQGSYKCDCPVGFQLARDYRTCEDIDECLDNNEINSRCTHDCVNEIGSYHCECPEGYIVQENLCTEVNECEINNGGCSHVCVDKTGFSLCECPEGLYLTIDNVTCLEKPFKTNCSQKSINNTCSCFEGFILSNDFSTCVDVDECLKDTGNCSQRCVNEDGSFHCECDQGYALDGSYDCVDVDECSKDNGNCSQRCVNEDGSFHCECDQGYALDDSHECFDVDECSKDNGNCSHRCVNEEGSFHCECYDGYAPENTNQCVDVDECVTANGGCSQICINNNGSFHCTCEVGFVLQNQFICEEVKYSGDYGNKSTCEDCENILVSCEDGYSRDDKHKCVDIDECEDNFCSQDCVNTLGSFYCQCDKGYTLSQDDVTCLLNDSQNSSKTEIFTCMDGYTLNDNNQTCDDIDECLENISSCSQNCQNTVGSYFCSCDSGYVLSIDNITCLDVDECSQNSSCSQICKNTVGSFICDCDPGYMLRNRTICDLVDPCQINNGGCSTYCNSSLGSVICSCDAGFLLVNSSQCVDFDECLIGNRCDQKCVNTHGSFYCVCHEGYYMRESQCVELPGCRPIQRPHMLLNCSCIEDHVYPVGSECNASCLTGYKLDGPSLRSCHENGSWSWREPTCIAVARPFIRCPKEIRQSLRKGQKDMLVHIPQPKTNVDWKRYVTSNPTWGKDLQARLPVGVTGVKYTATAAGSHYTSTCIVLINIIDLEKPEVENCPNNILLWLKPGSKTQKVIWNEPSFKDNVEVARAWKSKSPGQDFYAGVHIVSYIAVDNSGNVATCQFTVTIKDTASNPTAMLQYPSGPLAAT